MQFLQVCLFQSFHSRCHLWVWFTQKEKEKAVKNWRRKNVWGADWAFRRSQLMVRILFSGFSYRYVPISHTKAFYSFKTIFNLIHFLSRADMKGKRRNHVCFIYTNRMMMTMMTINYSKIDGILYLTLPIANETQNTTHSHWLRKMKSN